MDKFIVKIESWKMILVNQSTFQISTETEKVKHVYIISVT